MQTDITVHNPDQKHGIAMNNNPTRGSNPTSKVLGLTGTTKDASIGRLDASKLGPAGVYVNMSFSRTSPWGRVVSFLPDIGRLTVKTYTDDTFFLRPPHWAPRESVRAFVGAREIPAVWSGAYVRFVSSKPGDELTVAYPLVRFSHTPDGVWKGKIQPVVDLTFDGIGNTIVGSAPPPDGKPLFTGAPRILPLPPPLVDSSQEEGTGK